MPGFWENDALIEPVKPAPPKTGGFWERDALLPLAAPPPPAVPASADPWAEFSTKPTMPDLPPQPQIGGEEVAGPAMPSGDFRQRAVQALTPFYAKGVATRNAEGQLTGEAKAALTRANAHPGFVTPAFERKLMSQWEDDNPSTLTDMAKAVPSGLARGVAGLAGLPADLGKLARVGGNYFADTVLGSVDPSFNERAKRYADMEAAGQGAPDLLSKMGGGAITKAVEDNVTPLYRAKTVPGQFTQTLAEFAPSAALASGGMLAKAAQTAIPALASESAGQLFKGSAAEPIARAVAGIGSGLGATALARPITAGSIVSRSAGGLTPAEIDGVEALMRDAAGMGVALTRAEAAQAVTNGATRLGDLQRVVEGQGGLKGFMAERPGQVEAAGRDAFDRIAPVPATPSAIGPEIGRAASGQVADTTAAINRATRPLYQAAEPQRIGAPAHIALSQDPLYAQALGEVRGNPALNRTIEHLPDDAVGVIDLVTRRMAERAQGARVPGHADSGNLIAENLRDAGLAPNAAAEAVTGSRAATATSPAVAGTLEQAREGQSMLRRMFLEPLMAGPIGRLAQQDMTTSRAIEALFPKNPVPNSAGEIMDAVSALSARAPEASRQIVRAHAVSVFNQATRDLQSGANQFGGASFAAAIRGNAQEGANLAAAVRALPNGDVILPGFDRFLDAMSATGQRQRIGSNTSFNNELLDTMKGGGAVSTATKAAATGGLRLPKMVGEAFERWNLGKNTDEVARILTDPAAAPLFRQLASEKMPLALAGGILSRLVSLGQPATVNPAATAEKAGNRRP